MPPHSCSPPSRQAELDSLRAGKAKPSGRLGGLGGSSRLGGSRLAGLGGSSSRLAGGSSRLAGSKRGGLDLQPVRRSGRNTDKRVRCGGQGCGGVGSAAVWALDAQMAGSLQGLLLLQQDVLAPPLPDRPLRP